MIETIDRRHRILDVAQGLVQTRGYEGFSFADVAAEVGIRKASIHHHFPTKSDLALGLVDRFRRDCLARLASLDGFEPMARLEGFAGIFRETLESGRMCLCGILAAGIENLSEEVRNALRSALADQEAWLIGVIAEGQALGSFRSGQATDVLASSVLSSLEGALMLARVRGGTDRFDAVVRCLWDGLLP